MGMGEPLANLRAVELAVRTMVDPAAVGLGARRVTVSTVGLPRGIQAMPGWGVPVSLAISLHAPNDIVRSELVPVARRFPLDTLMDASRQYQQQARRRRDIRVHAAEGVNDGLTLARIWRVCYAANVARQPDSVQYISGVRVTAQRRETESECSGTRFASVVCGPPFGGRAGAIFREHAGSCTPERSLSGNF